MSYEIGWAEGFVAGYIQGGLVVAGFIFLLTFVWCHVRIEYSWVGGTLRSVLNTFTECPWCGCKHDPDMDCQ